MENPNIILTDICNANKETWAAMCKRTIQLLREDGTFENPYQYSLYMNYHAFNFSPQCGIIKIPISSEQSIDQNVSFCYGRPSVIPPTRVASIQNWPHFSEISIYPGINDTMMVFKCHGIECSLLEWYEAADIWDKLQPVHHNFFRLAVPETFINDKKELFGILHLSEVSKWSENKSNILWTMNIDEQKKLCDVLYARPEYNDKIILPRKRCKSEATSVKLKGWNENIKETFNVNAFKCAKYRKFTDATTLQYAYKIMAGPGNNSVILLEPLMQSHEAIELVNNIYLYNSAYIDTNY